VTAQPTNDSAEPARVLTSLTWYSDVESQQFAYVGPDAVRLLGFPAAAWYERGFWAEHLSPDDRTRVIEERGKKVTEGSDFEITYRMRSLAGAQVLVRELCAVMHHEDGSRGLRGLFLALDDSDGAPDQSVSHAAFTAFVAHELSQPVGAVLANVAAIQRMLRSSPPMLSDALEALDDVAVSARRITALIDWIRSAH